MRQRNPGEDARYSKWWFAILAILVLAIASGGGLLAWQHVGKSQRVEITAAAREAPPTTVYISGAVANEGIYAFGQDSSLADVLRAAGGPIEGADLASLRIYLPTAGETLLEPPQRINLNTADAWLLKALPGIGEVRAQAIIQYRTEHGLFNSVDELVNVAGIGPVTLAAIRDKITVL